VQHEPSAAELVRLCEEELRLRGDRPTTRALHDAAAADRRSSSGRSGSGGTHRRIVRRSVRASQAADMATVAEGASGGGIRYLNRHHALLAREVRGAQDTASEPSLETSPEPSPVSSSEPAAAGAARMFLLDIEAAPSSCLVS